MIMIIIKPTILRTRPSFIAGGGRGRGPEGFWLFPY